MSLRGFWDQWWSSLRLNPFAVEFEGSGPGDQPVSILQAGEHLDLVMGGLAQGDVVECGNFVLVEEKYTLHLSALDDGGLRDEQGTALSVGELRPAEKAGTKARVNGQFNFDQETAAAGVGGGDDLDNLAGHCLSSKRVDDNRHGLADPHEGEIAFVDRGFEPVTARIFEGEDGHAGC